MSDTATPYILMIAGLWLALVMLTGPDMIVVDFTEWMK